MKQHTLSLITWTLILMVIIGVVQIGLGVFQIYHPEEEAFEMTSSHELLSSTQEEKIQTIKDILISRRSSVQNYIDSLPPARAEAFVQKVNLFIASYDTDGVIDNFSVRTSTTPTRPSVTEVVTSKPVETNAHEWEPSVSEVPSGKKAQAPYIDGIVHVFLAEIFQSTIWALDVIVDHDRVHPRGQMKNKSVIMSAHIDQLDELSKVVVHEIAHVIDIYVLQKKGTKRDPSYDYYRISWEDVDTQRAGGSGKDFVSGYAATNQYEDFAEAFTFYLFHNQEFEKRAKESIRLEQKYRFLKDQVFGMRYEKSAYEKDTIPDYIWDTTKVELEDSARTILFP